MFGKEVFKNKDFTVYEKVDEYHYGTTIYTFLCTGVAFPVTWNKWNKVAHVSECVHKSNVKDNMLDLEKKAIAWVEKNHK